MCKCSCGLLYIRYKYFSHYQYKIILNISKLKKQTFECKFEVLRHMKANIFNKKNVSKE